ncbi:hypothetical protein HNV08_07145 [Winogradskyella eckloniae]|uniref:hypothetical protein n=1 Tax=Winogradskyella eckloniae TaxID=1089306 RepID=UPI0015631247|nr:hypothetical protein [Winogradskyella eckloniae]NRD19821.1 hypothetical protein [Winogradskyella eckloniae]
MKAFFLKLNTFIRNMLLDDVDKPYDKPLPYHRKFGSVDRQKNDIKQKRNYEQKQQSGGF